MGGPAMSRGAWACISLIVFASVANAAVIMGTLRGDVGIRPATASYATIAHRSGSPYSTYSGNAQTGVSVQAGDLIVVGYCYGANADSTCSDSASGGTNTYSTAFTRAYNANTAASITMFYAVAKATETLTITCTSQTDPGISVHVYSGVATTSPQSGSGATTSEMANSTSHPCPTITPGDANAVVVYVYAEENATSTQSAWTNSFTSRTDVTNHVHGTADRVVTSIAGYTTTFTSTANTPFNMGGAAFKAKAL